MSRNFKGWTFSVCIRSEWMIVNQITLWSPHVLFHACCYPNISVQYLLFKYKAALKGNSHLKYKYLKFALPSHTTWIPYWCFFAYTHEHWYTPLHVVFNIQLYSTITFYRFFHIYISGNHHIFFFKTVKRSVYPDSSVNLLYTVRLHLHSVLDVIEMCSEA